MLALLIDSGEFGAEVLLDQSAGAECQLHNEKFATPSGKFVQLCHWQKTDINIYPTFVTARVQFSMTCPLKYESLEKTQQYEQMIVVDKVTEEYKLSEILPSLILKENGTWVPEFTDMQCDDIQ